MVKVVEREMKTSLDTGHPVSENVVPIEVNEKLMNQQVSSAEIEVSGEVILGYVSHSHSEVPTQETMRNLDGTLVPTALDEVYRNREVGPFGSPR